jgi:hypothetical protein
MVGADVVAEPNGLAGDAVPSGAVTGAAEIVPGTVHPPYSPLAFSTMKESIGTTHLARVGIHVHRSPTLTSANGIVGEDFAHGRLSRIFWAEDENPWRFWIYFGVWTRWEGRAPVRGQRAYAHFFEGEMDIRVCVHGRFIRDVLRRWSSCDVLKGSYECGGSQEKKTHLDRASLPGEDGRLTFVAKEIVSTISKFCTKHFGVSFQNLGISF